MKLNVSDVSRSNRISVYRALLKNESLSRLELSRLLDISLPTVTKTIKSLIASGLAADSGSMASTGGRKATVTVSLPNARIALGVDITKNHIGFAAVNLVGSILAHVRLPKKFSHSPAYYSDISALAHAFLQNHKLPLAHILGTGVSLPGIVSAEGHLLLDSHMLSLKGPLPLPLPLLPQPCHLFNDATAACLAEIRSRPENSNFVFLCLSNSVGGALVRHGHISDGDNQRCAEFGHMTLIPGGLPCYCGRPGHYDSYGSALVLASHGNGRLEDFFQALASGSPRHTEVFSLYLQHLALMICNLRMATDTDVILGGYVGSFLAPYLPQLHHHIAALDTFASNPAFLHLCRHKFESSAVGAALHFTSQFIESV